MKPVNQETNPKTKDIHRARQSNIVQLVNEKDKTVAEAVSLVLDKVAVAVDLGIEADLFAKRSVV